jgi:hypothetical protein
MQDLLRTILIPPALALATVLPAQKTYTYSSVPGDPIGARIYKLDNGLTVYLSRNEDAPRIHTHIAVRAGSKHDPADATGLAHYLEHMLFKGTRKNPCSTASPSCTSCAAPPPMRPSATASTP